MQILFGIISGFISSIGMRRRNSINLSINSFFGDRPTYSTRSEFSFFYSNMCNFDCN